MTDSPQESVTGGPDHPFGEHLELEKVLNIGPVTAGWLHEVGITSMEQLAEVGSIEAWRLIKERHPGSVSLVGLYALEGAILGIPWAQLPDDLKAQLRGAARA
jgi:DNA transformation protein and related proteins